MLPTEAESPVVYIYHAQKNQIVLDNDKGSEPPFKIKNSRMLQPSLHSSRVAMQAGWHTVHLIHKGKDGRERVVPLTDMEWHGGRITTIKIDTADAPKLRRELGNMGIRHATVYGDLQAVCRSIRNDLHIG